MRSLSVRLARRRRRNGSAHDCVVGRATDPRRMAVAEVAHSWRGPVIRERDCERVREVHVTRTSIEYDRRNVGKSRRDMRGTTAGVTRTVENWIKVSLSGTQYVALSPSQSHPQLSRAGRSVRRVNVSTLHQGSPRRRRASWRCQDQASACTYCKSGL